MTTSTLPARFVLADEPAVDGQARILDAGSGRLVLTCHPTTAVRWLDWVAGRAGRVGWEGVDNDYRVCWCAHLCLSHSSLLPDYSLAPGVGNGECGVGGCGCRGFRPQVAAPIGGNSVDVVDTGPSMP